MEFKGKWRINNKEYAGTCLIDERNDITLTIHKSGLEKAQEIIVGDTDKGEVVLYNTFLIDNAPGYFKYRACSATNSLASIKMEDDLYLKKVNMVSKIKFKVSGLDRWLNKEKFIFAQEDEIKIIHMDDIVLLDNGEVKITIRYETMGTHNIGKANNLHMIKKEPYIFVESSNLMSCNQIYNFVKLVNRFFSLMIGYCEDIDVICCDWKFGECNYLPEFDLYLNNPSNHNLRRKKIYEGKPRVSYSAVEQNIDIIFKNWYLLYTNSKYRFPLNIYFLPNNNSILEEHFLQICKVVEYLYNVDNMTDRKKIEGLTEHLSEFFGKNSDELKETLQSCGINSKYIKNIGRITENIIESFVNCYKDRVNLDQKILRLDKNGLVKKLFKEQHIINRTSGSIDGYNAIRKTRNYYTHLDECEDIIDIEHVGKYDKVLEVIIIRLLLEKLDINDEEIEKSLSEDLAFSLVI